MNKAGSGGVLGVSLVAAGAVMLASKGLFAKGLYDLGLSHLDVAAIRSILAVPGFLLIALLQHQRSRRQRTAISLQGVATAMGAGMLCYYFGSLANFYALTLIQANVERALLFSYPAMVVALQALLARAWPPVSTLLALTATTGGVILVTGAADQALSPTQVEGIGWVLFCSMTIAVYFLVSGRLTLSMGAANFTAIAMTTAGAAFLVHYSWASEATTVLSFDKVQMITMGGLVLFATILPLFFMAEGVRRIGASRGALVSTLGPPATALMAYVLYRETLSVSQLAGTLLIIAAIAFLEWRGRTRV